MTDYVISLLPAAALFHLSDSQTERLKLTRYHLYKYEKRLCPSVKFDDYLNRYTTQNVDPKNYKYEKSLLQACKFILHIPRNCV